MFFLSCSSYHIVIKKTKIGNFLPEMDGILLSLLLLCQNRNISHSCSQFHFCSAVAAGLILRIKSPFRPPVQPDFSKSGRQIMELFDSLNEEGVTIVMITHDPRIAAKAKRIVRIIDGEIYEGEGDGAVS